MTMTRMILSARVGADGVLHVPLGQAEANREVRVTIEPARPRSALKIQDLNTFLQGLPKLGDDAVGFSEDVRAIRGDFPAEANPWD
jgi:hypothetical protein